MDNSLEDYHPKNWLAQEDEEWWGPSLWYEDVPKISNEIPPRELYDSPDLKEIVVSPNDNGDFGFISPIGMDTDEFLQIKRNDEVNQLGGYLPESYLPESYSNEFSLEKLDNEEVFDPLLLDDNWGKLFERDNDENFDYMKLVNVNEVMNMEDSFKPSEYSWCHDHTYCSDPNLNATVKPLCNELVKVETKKNDESEDTIDVWGPKKTLSIGQKVQVKKVFKQITDAMHKHAPSQCNVGGAKKLPHKKRSLSRTANSAGKIMKDLRVALKTCSGSRRSARNIKPKDSVETTPSGSDFEDGSMWNPPAKRACGNSRSVNRNSHKLISSEVNIEGESLHTRKRSTKKNRTTCQTSNRLPVFQLDLVSGYNLCSKKKEIDHARTTSQPVKKAKNKRKAGGTVPKTGKQKTLKEKQGHRESEKHRRDIQKDAFEKLRHYVPYDYMVANANKKGNAISKQKTLDGALRRATELKNIKTKAHSTWESYREFIKKHLSEIKEMRRVKKISSSCLFV